MRVLLKDIAAAAGVQPSTASLVLRNHPGARKFSRDTRESILATARRMGYVASPKEKRTRTIGFLLAGAENTDWSNHYYNRFLSPVESVCRASGYNLLISQLSSEDIGRDYFPSRTGERAVDGIIVTGYVGRELLQRIAEQNLPCVCLGDDIADRSADIASFSVDAVGMFMQIIRYLVRMNHHRIMLLLEDHERQLALCAELEAELAKSDVADQVVLGHYLNPRDCSDEAKGHAFLWHLVNLAIRDRPTAIVCNDRIGVGILGTLSKYNMSCPDDISLVATCDGDLDRASTPRLTAVDISAEPAECAVRSLIGSLEHGTPISGADSRNDFSTRLMIRDSVRSLAETAVAVAVGEVGQKSVGVPS